MINLVRTSSQQLTSVSTITPPTTGSICFWVTPTTMANNLYMIYCTSANFAMRFLATGALRFRLNIGTDGTTSGGQFVAGTRYHVVGTWNTTNNQELFRNAVSILTRTNTNAAVGAGTFYIGSDSGTNYFNGSIEDFRIYNRILSLPEIQTIYTLNGRDNIVYGLQCRLLMNEGSKGAVATGDGSVKCMASQQLNFTPANSPTYQESLLKFKKTNNNLRNFI